MGALEPRSGKVLALHCQELWEADGPAIWGVVVESKGWVGLVPAVS